jgi:hypothetical protein
VFNNQGLASRGWQSFRGRTDDLVQIAQPQFASASVRSLGSWASLGSLLEARCMRPELSIHGTGARITPSGVESGGGEDDWRPY